jgi:hypothetical protein
MAVSAISRRPDYRLLYNRYTIESGTKSCEIANNGSRPEAELGTNYFCISGIGQERIS